VVEVMEAQRAVRPLPSTPPNTPREEGVEEKPELTERRLFCWEYLRNKTGSAPANVQVTIRRASLTHRAHIGWCWNMLLLLVLLTEFLCENPDFLLKVWGGYTYILQEKFLDYFVATGTGGTALSKKEQANVIKRALRNSGCTLSGSSNLLGPGAIWELSEELHTAISRAKAEAVVISDSESDDERAVVYPTLTLARINPKSDDEGKDDPESDDPEKAAGSSSGKRRKRV
jgi:hypothetical protein